jgi:membrane protein DedA with SNARE-associated domain
MTEKINDAPQKISPLTIALFAFYFLVIVIIRWKVPSAEKVIAYITDLYQQYGYAIVFVSGILEALFLIGLYFPGSVAILLGAVVARSGVVSLPLIIVIGTLGMLIGYTVNYFMGKYGWYHVLSQFGLEKSLVEAEKNLKKHGIKAITLGYISPNTGSLISTAAGVMKMPFGKFLLLSAFCQLFWSSVWGTVAYLIGNVFVEIFLKYFTFVVWIAIIGWVVWKYVLTKKESS